MIKQLSTLAIVMLIGILGIQSGAQGQDLYLLDSPDIKIGESGGTASTVIAAAGNPLSAVFVDAATAKVYWASGGSPFAIRRANLDGSGLENLVTAVGTNLQNILAGIAVDADAGTVYWSDREFSGAGRLNRADVSGLNSNIEHIDVGGNPQRIALDVGADLLYWADSGAGQIRKIAITGGFTGTATPTTLVTGQSGATGIALDAAAGQIYWAIQEAGSVPSVIRRANDDGSGIETVLDAGDGLDDVRSIAVDGCGGKLYYADVDIDRVSRANLDGSGVDHIVTVGIPNLGDIALDLAGGGDPPVLTVPADVTVSCTDSTEPSATGEATATGTAPVTTAFQDTADLTGCNGSGSIVRAWTATDGCGNMASADQTISVADTTAPSITCPVDVTLECPADTSTAANGLATASDDCGTPTVSSNDNSISGCGATVAVTRTWTATDDCANSAFCDQSLAVVDTIAPVLDIDTSPITAVDADCSGDEAVTLPAASAIDACEGAVAVSDNASATLPAGQTTTVTFTATDGCGNSTQASVDASVEYGSTIDVYASSLTFGWGHHPVVSKEPLDGITVHVFERAGAEHCSHHQPSWAGWHWWRHVAHDCDESDAVNSGVTDSNGFVSIDVPPGDYIVVTFFDFDDDGEVDHYIGRRARGIACGQSKNRRLRLIITPRGKHLAARISRLTGSELLIVEPDLMIWDDQEQEYPFGFESEGDWGVGVSVEPPDGFVSDASNLDTDVNDALEGVQFTVTEVGSDLVPTKTTFEVSHNGLRHVVHSKVGIKLTPSYARERGFDPVELRAQGLIYDRVVRKAPTRRLQETANGKD
jgi:hypothetical protein